MKTILIVDDQEDIRKMLKRRLKRLYKLYFAENGKIGMEKAIELRPDLILMDMHMPIMDGYTATLKLREQNYSNLIVALTASAMVGQISKAKEAGCDEALTKPIDDDFEIILQRILGVR